MIHLLRHRATKQQLEEMLEILEDYIKLAVDVQRGIAAGGGELHSDCEAVLLADGSRQEDVWGAGWIPLVQEVRFEAMLNIRPRQNNPSMMLLDPAIRSRVEEIVKNLLEGV